MTPAVRRYFDWAATALPDETLQTAAAAPFANPSSRHAEGRAAKDALEAARSRTAAVLGVSPREIVFTAGGTESNALVIHSFLRRRLESGATGALLYSAVEHPSVRENIVLLQRYGLETGEIAVGEDGRVSVPTLEKALAELEGRGKPPSFAAIMAVNNETGAINDIAGLVRQIRMGAREGRPVHVHVDCVQALGKIDMPLKGWDVDSASFSAHKLGGPRGIGAIYLRKPLLPPFGGGGQEGGIRSGTENVAGALLFAAALEKHAGASAVRENALLAGRNMARLTGGLRSIKRCMIIPPCRSESTDDDATDPGRFSPYIISAAFDGIPGEVFVRALDERGFAISTGSACSQGKRERPALAALSAALSAALGGTWQKAVFESVRFSIGRTTAESDIDALLLAVTDILKTL